MSDSTLKLRPGLGKGLAALIGDIEEEETVRIDPETGEVLEDRRIKSQGSDHTEVARNQLALLPIDLVEAGPYQPRAFFEEEALHELADSIKKRGVLQPIVVCTIDESGKHKIVAGERRWRASKLAGIPTIPAIVRDFSEQEALEIALIENIQRRDLTVIEEAEGYQRLIDECNYTQDALAKHLGKSRSHVTNILRLLGLPDSVKKLLSEGKLTMGHARAILRADNPDRVAEIVVTRDLSVRQTENMVRGDRPVQTRPREGSYSAPMTQSEKGTRDPDLVQLEQMLARELGVPVIIHEQAHGGRIEIGFNNLQQLDDILQRLTRSSH